MYNIYIPRVEFMCNDDCTAASSNKQVATTTAHELSEPRVRIAAATDYALKPSSIIKIELKYGLYVKILIAY